MYLEFDRYTRRVRVRRRREWVDSEAVISKTEEGAVEQGDEKIGDTKQRERDGDNGFGLRPTKMGVAESVLVQKGGEEGMNKKNRINTVVSYFCSKV